ncbi:related to NOT3-general negative regulator of transcription, subunit 3 [Serendipita indica DSM 11827]|uniref:General negative regulator of transcription subunit n=1 Tax=Serendipita indica (strain DSM 11827) TaxID=1109443 RepID=G4TRS0_SERID|nr:related to NOT3-general negative regulator of transcription, subunit 3 [Serendipita indica DSM 11827]
MAARKLQAEMDRTFKKIQEGVENFEDIESKMNAAGTAAQKEKLEADLKTQIKKLQRLRDQLKTWQTGTDVKDKTPIIDHRRLIEVQMEKFKMIEKEMKTKQYSTVGLISHSKLDPKEQQRMDLIGWLQGKVEELQMQIETAEAELETLQAGTKKKGKSGDAGQARTELLELQNERRSWHITQLEIILRLVENSNLQVEDVEAVKEDVDFFVTMNAEEDFEYDDGVYADLNLENYVDAEGDNDSTVASDAENDEPPPPKPAPRKSKAVEEDEPKEEPITKRGNASSSTARPRAKSSTKPTDVPTTQTSKPPVPVANFVQQPMSSVVKGAARAPMPTLRYADAAALGTSTAAHPPATSSTTAPSSAVPQTPATAIPPAQVPTPPAPANASVNLSTSVSSSNLNQAASAQQVTPASDQADPLSPSERAVSSVAPSAAASPIAIRRNESVAESGNNGTQGLSESYGAPSAPSVTSMSLASPDVSLAEVSASPQVARMPNPENSYSDVPLNQGQNSYTLQGILPNSSIPPGLAVNGMREPGNMTTKTDNTTIRTILQRPTAAAPGDDQANLSVNNGTGTIGAAPLSPGVSNNENDDRASQHSGQQPPKFAATLSDLMSSFRAVQNISRDSEQVKDVLEAMSPSMPQPRDAERPKYHTTRNPTQTPSYYPQQMLPLLSSPEFFERLDVETLFWVFYYMPGTYQQWLAAQELKKQSWRFHVKFLTWFQRHAKPDEVTDEYEQGQYLYFDWEGSWCVRKKSGFRFEYRNLSDD